MASKKQQLIMRRMNEGNLPSKTSSDANKYSEKANGGQNKDVAAAGKNVEETTAKGKAGENSEENNFKPRAMLEKQLSDKEQKVQSLEDKVQQQGDRLKDTQCKMESFKELWEATKTELRKCQEQLVKLPELEKRSAVLTEETSSLRQELETRDDKIRELEKSVDKNALQTVLRKENVELNHERDELKIERDRLRRSLKEKQEQMDKMNASIGDLQGELSKARRSLDERVKASTLLERRLENMDCELKKYHQRFANQEIENKRLSDANKSNDSALSAASTKDSKTQKHMTLLQQKEENLLQDQKKLEKEVNILNIKIKFLEGQLKKNSKEHRPVHGRASQTELGELSSDVAAVKKCKGIVKSLSRFFDELIANQDSPKASSRGRRTAIAAQRGNELLHELSLAIDYITDERKNHGVTQANNISDKGTQLWDKVCEEVAQHEFTFESPTNEKEVKRAQKALNQLYHVDTSYSVGRHDKINDHDRDIEMILRDLLHKHADEMKRLLERCQDPSTTVSYDHDVVEIDGKEAASIVLQELNSFKGKTAKIQGFVMKMQAVIQNEKQEKENAKCQIQALEHDLSERETLLEAKTQELRRRHCKSLESEKTLQTEKQTLQDEKARASSEIARLHDVCRHKDLQIVDKVQEIKSLHAEIGRREKTHEATVEKMKAKIQEAWQEYTSVKTRAERRSAEFNDAAEKLKMSQGYLLDLWQTLKTVDNVVETNDDNEDL